MRIFYITVKLQLWTYFFFKNKTMTNRNANRTMPLTGHRKASQTTGPTLVSSTRPAKMKAPPMRKPSFIPYGLFHIILSQFHTPATTSISTNAPFGKVFTATAERAGYGSEKNSA